MISFTLRCAKDHEFEGWFRDSDAFEKQRRSGDLSCPVCGNQKIEQGLSRPNISTSRSQSAASLEQAKAARKALKALRQEVEQSCENVGDRFAEEARKIHYGETDERGIYGRTSAEEAGELIEEGITVMPLPWIEETKEN